MMPKDFTGPIDRIEYARRELRLAQEELSAPDQVNGEDSVTNAMTEGPPPEAKPSSLVVGFAEGAPGEEVLVDILGGTHLPVQGFGLAIGCNPMVNLVDASESEELRRLLNITDVEDIKKQHRRSNDWQDNWIQIHSSFYRELWGTDDAAEAVADAEAGRKTKVTRTIAEVRIPPMTPLYALTLKIPDDATPGMKFELDIEHRYGRRLKSNGPVKFLEWPPMFATSRQVAQFGIPKKDIELVSGWIEVTE